MHYLLQHAIVAVTISSCDKNNAFEKKVVEMQVWPQTKSTRNHKGRSVRLHNFQLKTVWHWINRSTT